MPKKLSIILYPKINSKFIPRERATRLLTYDIAKFLLYEELKMKVSLVYWILVEVAYISISILIDYDVCNLFSPR